VGRPQKSNVFKANATALGDMATPLRSAAATLLDSAWRVHEEVFGFDWKGHTKDAADTRADREYMEDRGVAAAYDKLADAYEHGAKAMQPMIDSLKSKAQGLEGDHFAVSEDWAVTDTYDYAAARKLAKLMDPDDSAGLQSRVDQLQTQRANEAATETTNLQRLADQLGTADTETAQAINDAKQLLAVTTDPNGPQIVVVDDTQRQPTIAGPASGPVQEQQQGFPYDLGMTIPGTGILITGDPKEGRPQLHIPGTKWNGDNPFPTLDGERPLPTGTAVGPNGQQYAFYSIKRYGSGTEPKAYIAPESHVQNLADPAHDLGALHGTLLNSNQTAPISQASGVYNPRTQQMVIVGNIGADGQRALWQSDPIKPGDPPNAWMNSMHQTGTFTNLGAGDRENQIVGLPQSGYLLTSASNGHPVVGLTAATPDGLVAAAPQPLTPGSIPSPGNLPAVPYGPTVTNIEVLPNGQQQVTLRTSTWPSPEGGLVGPDAPPTPYNPRTYTSTFGINP
jgi:hypothetical protein